MKEFGGCYEIMPELIYFGLKIANFSITKPTTSPKFISKKLESSYYNDFQALKPFFRAFFGQTLV